MTKKTQVGKIICSFEWEEPGSVCLESRAAGKGDSCFCIIELPTNALSSHGGFHVCECGEMQAEDANTDKFTAIQKIRRVLQMDDTRLGVIPVHVNNQFQSVVQTALMLDIAESLRELIYLLEED